VVLVPGGIDSSTLGGIGTAGVALLGSLVSGGLAALLQLRSRRDTRAEEPSFADRVDQAIAGLRSASQIVEDLESEIDERRAAVERLQDQQDLLRLDQSEIDAVSRLLQGDARRESRRAIWISAAASAIFFLAGVGVTLLLQ
jgi:hypothetical protein